MKEYAYIGILIFLILLCFLYLYYYNYNKDIEYFTPYSYGPFNYMDTGADPLSFYKYPVYRKPYMYPYTFYSSFPYPYLTYGQINV